MITRINVFDCDGCIVDSSHRYRTLECGTRIDLPYWIANEHRTLEDTLLPLAEYFQSDILDPTTYTVIATARIWCNLSRKFAATVLGEPNHVIARRGREDTRGGAALKIEGVKKLLNLKQFNNVREIHVYEDNINYCRDVSSALGAIGHYYPSNQGH